MRSSARIGDGMNTNTQRKLDNIYRRNITMKAKMDAAYSLGYSDGHEAQMKARILDEQERNHEREQCPICKQRGAR